MTSSVDEAGYIPTATTGLVDLPDIDSPSCQLLGPTALIVQGLMGVFVILSLVYKRYRETPRRPWRIWIFDVSKQVCGQMFVHGLNVLISGVISDVTDGNACVSYFLNILIDTTFGVAVIYWTLHALTWLFSVKLALKGFESGVYGNPPSFKFWIRQAALYVVSLTTMKLVVIALLMLFPGIFKIGEWLLSWTWTGEGDHLQVIFVMGIFPIVMNVLQFWLIDSIVKASAGVVLEGDVEQQLGQDHEPLFDAPSDDDDDDDDRYRRTLSAEGQRLHKPSSSSFDSGFASQHLSQSTGITTPPDIESKSIESSKNRSPPTDQHAYPPSLSGSLKSNSSTSSKTRPLSKASSLRTKRPTEATVAGSSQHRPTVPETRPEEHSQPTDEWAVSWDDEEDDGWADGTHTKGQGGSQPLPRSRRLS